MLRIDRAIMAHRGEHSGSGHMTKTSTMAVLRFHKKRVLLVFLVACLFWLMYMLSILPSKKKDYTKPLAEDLDKSISRKYFTPSVAPKGNRPVPNVQPEDNVIDVPQLLAVNGRSNGQANISGSDNKPEGVKNDKPNDNHVDVLAIGSFLKNKTYKLGETIRNKTVEMGEKMKNKTLEQIAVIGGSGAKSKVLPQLISVPQIWNLSVSFEDIGDIMNETQFLNKVDPLNMDGPILLSTRNRTANFTYSMPLKFGFCDCFEHYCVCCTKILNRRLHLNSTACSNFTFVSKKHELDLQFSLDGKPVHRSQISADKSPLLCLGSIPKVADICVHFFNMTFKVNEHNAHQTQLLGCTDLSLNLYRRTIGAFPVDCFQIPGDPNQVHKDRKFNMLFNWVP